MSFYEDLREFANLPLRLQLSALSSIPSVISGKGSTGLRILRTSPRLAYGLSQLMAADRFVQSVGLGDNLVQLGLEAAGDFERLNGINRRERTTGYATGAGLNSGQLIVYSVVRCLRPDLVVETGVASGISSYFILLALQRNNNGRLISVDLPNLTNRNGYVNEDGVIDTVYTPPDRGPGWVVPENLRARWQLELGRSMDILPKLAISPDIFLHDSDHSYNNMMNEFIWARDSGATAILSDDIQWNSAWLDFVRSSKLRHAEVSHLGISLPSPTQRDSA